MRDTNIKIDRDKCVACGICVDRCIMDNLRLSIAPCRQACPLNLNCQGYVRLIAQGKEEAALGVMKDVLPFIGLLSRLCPAPCEKACARGKVDAPVPIRALKRYLVDRYSVNPTKTPKMCSSAKGHMAVTGSGPAGLMAAWTLRKMGYRVTVFEKESRICPELEAYGFVADFPETEIEVMHQTAEAAGIVFELEAAGGRSISPETLEVSFDAVIVPGANGRQSRGRNRVFYTAELGDSSGSVVKALASGRQTAQLVHCFLTGQPPMWGRGFWKADGNIRECHPPYDRARYVGRTEAGAVNEPLTMEEARIQAERCLGCGRPFDVNETCWYCLPCEIECPHQALEVRIPYLVR